MKRRGFLARIGAALVVAAASPTAIVAPRTWERVKRWRVGYLTPEQADRFIALVLDQTVLAKNAKVVPLRAEKQTKIRLAHSSIDARGRITAHPGPRMTNRQLVEKAKLSLGSLYGEPDEPA